MCSHKAKKSGWLILIFMATLEKAMFLLIFRTYKLGVVSVLLLKTDMLVPWYVNSQNVPCVPALSS